MSISRRDFLATTAMTSVSLALPGQEGSAAAKPAAKSPQATGKRPVIICKTTGNQAMEGAYQMLQRGGDTLDAALFVCKAQEDDPNDDSVGLGGLPNEEGVVELDSCCMHGPTRRAGSVGGVRNIKNVCLVAKAVMERTGHVMLVAEGAERFAVAEGFHRENLLTDHSRRIWLLWKETNSDQDWWGPGLASPEWKYPPSAPKVAAELWEQKLDRMREVATRIGIPEAEQMDAIHKALRPPTGTIHVSVVNDKGEMSGATTTSGLAWKLPGRLGDSPIIGAGCYTDQDVGSAGATGSGEENIKVAGAHSIVENMRKGMSPQEAGLEVLGRIARNYNNDWSKLRFIDMVYYILRKDGAYAGVSFWSHSESGARRKFAVHDGNRRIEETVAFKQGSGIDWPPTPALPKAAAAR
ncbi:MAG: N(4)-(beta-N-acetylglucosaminyl)-L-asparaginase [Candidatus Koribacter versatilis]|uniref:N(4)-(Beta-N-acetylglucosaminyl)-L-asparaginase n=1 Tax=Candidatus Korobacter versatilis TaxID=658062 RepID=A0A932A6Z4_9BACT|nr:N(4)-(beta-N-acetylglucosaminyl)-L-asparaginase [Candidatus Koribacter versatilis]